MLNVVAFGTSRDSWYGEPEDGFKMKQIVFTRGKTIDGRGRTKMTALETLLKHVKSIEPTSKSLLRECLVDVEGRAEEE